MVSSVCLAELGHSVDLIEIDYAKVASLNSGRLPMYEEGLEGMLVKHMNHNLTVTADYNNMQNTDATFVCVGTPSSSDGSADLSMIKSACNSIGEALLGSRKYHVVAVKSTVPPGTTEEGGGTLGPEKSSPSKSRYRICHEPRVPERGTRYSGFHEAG